VSIILSDLGCDVASQSKVSLCVNLGHVGLGVTEEELCGLEAVLAPHAGCAGVPDLMDREHGDPGLQTAALDRFAIGEPVVGVVPLALGVLDSTIPNFCPDLVS